MMTRSRDYVAAACISNASACCLSQSCGFHASPAYNCCLTWLSGPGLHKLCLYGSRYDYEGVESEGANKMVEHLEEVIAKSKKGDKLGEYTLEKADQFDYTDPIDGSVARACVLSLMTAAELCSACQALAQLALLSGEIQPSHLISMPKQQGVFG